MLSCTEHESLPDLEFIVMRGDIARLGRCTSICTQGEDTIRRSKPFKYAYEKEIVMYVLCLSCRLQALVLLLFVLDLAHPRLPPSTGMHTSKS